MAAYRDNQSSPAVDMFLATKSDTVNETIYGYPYSVAAGNIKVTTLKGRDITVPVAANQILPLLVTRVWSTGTMGDDVWLISSERV